MNDFDISTMPIPELERLLITLCTNIEEQGLRMATAKADYEILDDTKDVVWNGALPDEGTVSAKERVAYTSKGYQLHLEGLNNARKLYYEAKVKYEAANAKFEAVRSIISLRKYEIERGL